MGVSCHFSSRLVAEMLLSVDYLSPAVLRRALVDAVGA
jgi:hypothetical protein